MTPLFTFALRQVPENDIKPLKNVSKMQSGPPVSKLSAKPQRNRGVWEGRRVRAGVFSVPASRIQVFDRSILINR